MYTFKCIHICIDPSISITICMLFSCHTHMIPMQSNLPIKSTYISYYLRALISLPSHINPHQPFRT